MVFTIKIVFWAIAVIVPLAVAGERYASDEEMATQVFLSSLPFIAVFYIYRWFTWLVPAIAPPVGKGPIRNDEGQVEIWSPRGIFWGGLFLSPFVFIYLNRMNWITLGNYRKAEDSLMWLYMFIPAASLSNFGGWWRLSALAWILFWLLSHNREQYVFVKDGFGEFYKRKSFGIPVLISVAILAVSIFLNSEDFTNDDLTFSEAVPTVIELTDDLIYEYYEVDKSYRCVDVVYKRQLETNHYLATAIFDDGWEIEIEIEIEGVYVTVKLLE